jgi:hypothetical protein
MGNSGRLAARNPPIFSYDAKVVKNVSYTKLFRTWPTIWVPFLRDATSWETHRKKQNSMKPGHTAHVAVLGIQMPKPPLSPLVVDQCESPVTVRMGDPGFEGSKIATSSLPSGRVVHVMLATSQACRRNVPEPQHSALVDHDCVDL